MNWKEQPVITTINTVAYPVENIEFPAITICSQGSAKDLTEIAIYRQFQTFLDSKNATTDATNVGKSGDGKRRKRESVEDLKEVFILNGCLRIKVDMQYNYNQHSS